MKNFSSKCKKLVFRQKIYTIYVWKTLNDKIYEIGPSYTQYSKKIKACGLTKKPNNFTSGIGHNP